MDAESFAREKIKWLGHASFRIDGEKAVVFIDPWKLKTPLPADVVCLTHSHFDHLSVEDVEKILKDGTVIVGPPDCADGFGDKFQPISAGESRTIGEITVEAVPAYNTDKDFHPQSSNWVGYVVAVDGIRVYHTGDTDKIPEMKDINADIALVPVGGTYTMTVEQAAQAVADINPKVAVPMHCGDIVGSLDDREAFKKACSVPVVILDPVQ